uniref:Integrase catalytic domain-containing protein n=1 Tax=Tanacetum cinerariifolium TaxID=118510 RepID=A0A6L2JDP4_TANCI|nr:hypothetical protein [Tanacetum cinerariifolium]
MKEGMSILRGRKSVPGMNNSEREMERGYYSAFTTNEADTTDSGVSTAHTQEDLEQIDPDDLKEMDLHWEMAMLTIRARSQKWNVLTVIKMATLQESAELQRIKTIESYQAEEKIPTNYAFMALTSSGSSSSSESESLEERLEHYKKNKAVLTNKINVLNLDVKLRDKVLDSQVSDKSKVGLGYKGITPDSFVNSSELLEKLENRSDKEYHAVPLPLTRNYMPPNTIDVNHKGVFNTEEPKPVIKNNFSPPIIEDWHSDDDSEEEISPTVEDARPMRNNSNRVNKKNFDNKMTHLHPKRGFVPQVVLTMSGKINIAGSIVTTAARLVNTAGSKSPVTHPRPKSKAFQRGHSKDTRPNNKFSANKNSIFNKMVNTVRVNDSTARDRAVVSDNMRREGNPQQKEYKEKGVIESGCSRYMTGNKCYLTDFEAYDGGFVSFGDGKGRISSKGKIKTGKLDFYDVYFCKELKYNLFSVSLIIAESSKKDNIYSVDLKSVVPTGDLTCLFAKATLDESNLWHRRLGHINFKAMNKLVKGNLVRGLPSKIFQNDNSCVACQKGKQHKATYKAKLVNTISKPLHMLHMDLFGPTNVKSLMKMSYCLVVTDDFSIFSWVFFLATKGEISRILKTFITGIENQLDCKVKVIRCDNGTEFKNSVMNQFCEDKGIKREYSITRTPQQNKVSERRNKTLIEAARTMALVTKPHNKTPYEVIRGRPPLIDFMKPFGCHVTILNTRDNLGKFEGKADEGYFVGYSVVSKAMRVFNKRIGIVEETLNIRFQENTTNVKGNGPDWLFGQDDKKKELEQDYIMIPICTTGLLISQDTKDSAVDARKKAPRVDESKASDNGGKNNQVPRSEVESQLQQERQTENINSTNSFNTVSSPVNTVGSSFVNAASQHQLMLLDLLIEEEVYVCQPLSFEDPNFLDKVYKVEKALYGLHQATRAWFQVNPKTSHLYDVKRISRYLKGQPKLGLWYPKDSPFNLEAYSDSDYAGASLDRKSTTGEYVVAVNCYGRVLWIQNQILGYGFNLMNTKIYIDNESTICIVKNLVFHSKTKHIEIRHHFIRDSYEKKLIQVIKIHTDKNVADLLTKAFAKDGRCFVDTSKVTTGNPLLSTAGLILILLDKEAQIWFEATSKKFNEPPLSRINTLGSRENGIKHRELMDFCTNYLNRLLGCKMKNRQNEMATVKVKKDNDQEQIQALVDKTKVIITEDSIKNDLRLDDAEGTACLLSEAIFEGLMRMGRKQRKEAETSHDKSEDEDHVPTPSIDPLPSGEDSSILNELMEDASRQGRMIEEIDQNAEIALDDETQRRTNDDEMFRVNDLAREEVVMDSVAEPVTTVKDSAALTIDVTEDEIIMAQALAALKSVKPKVVVQEQEISTTIPAAATKVTTAVPTLRAKGKDKMIKPEVPIKKKDQMRIDEECARKLQAKEKEVARLSIAQQDEEANNSWDNIQAMMDANRLLAKRLQAR